MKKVKYKKIIPALFGGLNFKSIPCVVSATITSKPVQLDDGNWYWLDASGVRDGVLESVAILGNGTVQIDFGLARVGENFTYSDGSAIQNDTVPVGGVWTVPNTVKVNTFTTLDGNIFNLENADQARIWSVTSLNETIDILNVTIGSDVVIDNRFISYANQYGYRLSGTEIIPPYLVDGKAVSAADGNVLDFKGKVRVNSQIIDNACIIGNATAKLQFNASQDGETLTYRNAETGVKTPVTYVHSTGWLIPSVYIDLIEFSGGSKYLCAEVENGVIFDVVNDNDAIFVTADLAINRTNNDKAEPHNLNGFSQKLVCETSGTTSIPFVADLTSEDYVWEFILSHSDLSVEIIPFFADRADATQSNYNGYGVVIDTNENIFLRRNTTSGFTNIIQVNGVVLLGVNTIKVKFLQSTNTFELYLNETLIGSVIDSTHTIASNFVTSLQSSEEIKNLSINGVTQNLMKATDGTGTYSKVRVPATNVTTDAEGDELSNPAGIWSNNPESNYIWPKCYATINADSKLSSPYLTDGAGNMVAKSHDDLVPNVLNEDIIFANALDETKKSEVVITDGTCDFYTLLRIQRELDLIDGPLRITETGEIVRITETDEPIYVTKY